MRTGQRYRFGEFELDLARECLVRRGAEVPLAPQPFALLRLLVERADELVTREEAAERIWGDRAVETEQGLNYCVRQIRLALGDSADSPAYVQTVPRRGYRFVAEVGMATPPAAETMSRPALLGLAAATLVGIVAGSWWMWTPTDAEAAHIFLEPARVDGLEAGEFIGDALLDRLRDDLAELPGVRIVDVPQSDFHGYQFVVRTRLGTDDAGVRIDLRLLEGREQEAVWSARATAAEADLLPLEHDLRHDLLANLRSMLDGTAIEGQQTIERARQLPDDHDHDDH
ncbi:MAG: hypothetical protein GKS06_09870 [Acidobacteria bacterium]|nr:hypothetical protein [Acidobacteriota bacterium]